jgi:gamma-glutamyl-gamma-aminobutyrate hydrolase PuuD
MVTIGLFTNPGINGKPDYMNKELYKWIESCGAACKSIDYTSSHLEVELATVHGVVMGGGAVENKAHSQKQRDALFDAYSATFQYAKRRGLPVLAICLGCQMTILLSAGSRSFRDLDRVEMFGETTLSFVADASMRNAFTNRAELATSPCVAQRHRYGVKLGSTLLKGVNLISIGDSPQGKYANMVQVKGYPFFGIMWHPEKAWNEQSVKVSTQLFDFFKLECRKVKRGRRNDSRSMLHVRQTPRRQVPLLRPNSTARKRARRASSQILYGRRVHEKDD